MKITRAKSKSFESGVLCTFIRAGEAVPSSIQPGRPTSEREFIQRIRRQRKQRQYVGELPLIESALSYRELSLKYAADIEGGRQLQKRLGL